MTQPMAAPGGGARRYGAAYGKCGPAATGNLAVALEELAWKRGWSANTAYVVGGQRYSYADVYQGMRDSAAALRAHNVRPGDRVLLVLPDGIEFVWCFLATMYLGAVAILANHRLPAHELSAAAYRADPVLVICTPALSARFHWVTALPPARITGRGKPSPPATAHACAPCAPAYALFTSGTTGDPKLCFHAHADAFVFDQAFGRPALGLRPGDITLSVSSTYFAYGLGNSVFYPLASGATAVLDPAPQSADTVLASIARFRIRVIFGVPSFYARLLSHPMAERLASVSIAVCAGEVLPGSVEERMEALGGPVLLNGIGSTEVGQTFASNTVQARRPGTVGRALAPYRIRVVDDTGGDMPAGAEGRLLVQGPTIALPCDTARDYQRASRAVWHATGDLATVDSDSFLRVSGRCDDVEIAGGINVHPGEVENILASHPSVRDVAVCATVDSRGVSRLVAYVVAVPNTADRLGLEADLLATARHRLAAFKVPRGVVFVSELPRTFTGKLRRHLLRKAAARYERTASWPLLQHAEREGSGEG